MSGELGDGFFLDQTLDFEIAPDGDLRGEKGADELSKDLAFQLIIILDDLQGQPLTPDVRGQVKSLTVDTLLSDSRVVRVDESGIRVRQIGEGTLRVAVSLTTTEGPEELVFNL